MTGKKPFIICDFDGTISIGDVGERLLENFLGSRWRELDDDYHAGRYGMVELYRRSFAEIAAGEDEFAAFVEGQNLDPDFIHFVEGCARARIPIVVVSDGFDFYIERLLARSGLELPVHSNKLRFEDGCAKPAFPNPHPDCLDCANCKREIVDEVGKDAMVVYIGNGLSDCCAAPNADLIYAKDGLAEHLCRARIPFESYNDFGDVIADFRSKGLLNGGEKRDTRATEKRSS